MENMDNINNIISSLTPNDIDMLKDVAASILSSDNQNQEAPENNSASRSPDASDLSSMIKNVAGSGAASNNSASLSNPTNALTSGLGLDGIDFNMIMKAKSIFEKMNNTPNRNADLILALKPHLRPETQNKADQALRILKLFEVLPLLKELF